MSQCLVGHFHRATLAFETVVTLFSGSFNAHCWLATVNSRPGGDLAKAAEHRRLIAQIVERRRAAVAGRQ